MTKYKQCLGHGLLASREEELTMWAGKRESVYEILNNWNRKEWTRHPLTSWLLILCVMFCKFDRQMIREGCVSFYFSVRLKISMLCRVTWYHPPCNFVKHVSVLNWKVLLESFRPSICLYTSVHWVIAEERSLEWVSCWKLVFIGQDCWKKMTLSFFHVAAELLCPDEMCSQASLSQKQYSVTVQYTAGCNCWAGKCQRQRTCAKSSSWQ